MDVQENGKVPTQKKSTKSDVDGSWAWVILLATTLNAVIATGQITSIHIYYVVFLKEFKSTSSFTAWIPAAQNTALCLAGPLTSALLKKLGSRCTMFLGAILMAICYIFAHFANSIPYLILNYACIGVGFNFIDGGNLAALAMYFHKKMSFATGLMYAGAGIGFMIMGLEIEWAVETYGWRGAMLIQSGLALQMCASAALIYTKLPTSEKVSMEPENRNGHNDCKTVEKELLSSEPPKLSMKALSLNPMFWFSVIELVAFQGNMSAMNTILKGWVIATGHESLFKIMITTIGLGNMVGRIISGPISNRVLPPIYMLVVSIIYGIVNSLFLVVDSFWSIASLGFAFGFLGGQILVCWVLKIAWAFGQKEFAIVRGYVFFFGITACLSFPPMIGYTVDLTDQYDISLIISSSCGFCCAISGLLSLIINKRKHSKPKISSDSNDNKCQISVIAIKQINNANKDATSVTCIPG